MLPKINIRYYYAAAAYGAIRKNIYTWNENYRQISYDPKTHEKIIVTQPILYTERLCMTALASITTFYLTPLYVLGDLRNIELSLRKMKSSIDPPMYSKDFISILFDPHF